MNPPSRESDCTGLLGWLEASRVVLPLKLVECRFHVNGAFAHVEIDQVFRQDQTRPVDCRYAFPLPENAAVHRCEMHVNERVIRARVEDLETARKTFASAKASGHRAALIETERPNFFTLQLGNLQPDDLVIIRLAYVQTLERIAGELRLRIPLTPGVRYFPGRPLLRSNGGPGLADDTDQVPDASRLSPPRIDAFHPDAAIFSLRGELPAADVAPRSLGSPTHAMRVTAAAESLRIETADAGDVPDRDAVVRWEECETAALESSVFLLPAGPGSDRDYALIQLRPPSHARAEVDTSGGDDFYFLLDRSGSMQGLKWDRACAALRGFVDRLNAADRVFVTLFESSWQDFSHAPLTARELKADPEFRRIHALGVAGGTELLPAASHLVKVMARHSADRRRTLVLLTDGQVGNEREILEFFRAEPELVIHTFGIDTAVNDALLKRLARRHRGECWLVTPDDDIAGAVSALGARLGQPVRRDLRLETTEWSGPEGLPVLPDLHAGLTQEILLSAPTGSRAPSLVAGDRPLPLRAFRTSNDAVRLAWVRARLEELEFTGRRPEALALAKQNNLLCEGTAFVAWDEVERVAIAQEEVFQPSMVAEESVLLAYAPAPCAPPPSPLAAPAPMRSRKSTALISRVSVPPPMQFRSDSCDLEASAVEPDLPVILGLPVPLPALVAWLTDAGLAEDVAAPFARAVLEWLLMGDPALAEDRRARLADWREALRESPRKLALCAEFLRLDIGGGSALMEAARQTIRARRAAEA